MPARNPSDLSRMLPQLRRDCETSRTLARRAVERATRFADQAVATRQLLETRAHQPRDHTAPNSEIWEAAARELVRVSRERDRELGVVAHELRQSLGAALAADRLIAVSTSSEMQERARGVLSRQLVHLSNLIDNLLDYSRLSVNAVRFQGGTVDVVDIVQDAIESVATAAADRRQDIRLAHDGGPTKIVGDPVRLRQAALNLLQNAVRYTPEEGRIDVSLSSTDSRVMLQVRDTGEGIAADRLESIFDPFVRVSAAGPGLGIGLALVRRIVELHGGTIGAASAGPGRGSVFTVSLPQAKCSDGS